MGTHFGEDGEIIGLGGSFLARENGFSERSGVEKNEKNLAKRSGVDSERRVYSKDKRASRLETPNNIPFWTFLCWKMEEEDGKDGGTA